MTEENDWFQCDKCKAYKKWPRKVKVMRFYLYLVTQRWCNDCCRKYPH